MRPITLILTLATTLLAGCVDTTVETSDGDPDDGDQRARRDSRQGGQADA